MLNRVGPKPADKPQQPDPLTDVQTRPGPSPVSAHPTGPAPPFEYGPEPAQGDIPGVPEQKPIQSADRRR